MQCHAMLIALLLDTTGTTYIRTHASNTDNIILRTSKEERKDEVLWNRATKTMMMYRIRRCISHPPLGWLSVLDAGAQKGRLWKHLAETFRRRIVRHWLAPSWFFSGFFSLILRRMGKTSNRAWKTAQGFTTQRVDSNSIVPGKVLYSTWYHI